jgi:hypothetical protein
MASLVADVVVKEFYCKTIVLSTIPSLHPEDHQLKV